jgi:hypothetical protein
MAQLHFVRQYTVMSNLCCHICCLLAAVCSLQTCAAADSAARHDEVQQHLRDELRLLGHRNWIVIADMAYPKQVSPGIETVYVGGDHLSVIREVIDMVNDSPHVRPVIYLDKELSAVSDADAPGIGAFREGLAKVLDTKETTNLPHEAMLAKLDKAAKTYSVVILKTDCTLPYTTVFVRLECGYWSDAAEKRMRKSLQ